MYMNFVRETERKTPFGTPSHRRVDNIKTDIREIWCRAKTGISNSGQRHVAGNSKHGEALGFIKCAEFVDLTTNSYLLRKESTPSICVKKNQLDVFFTQIHREAWWTKHNIYTMQLSSHEIFGFYFLVLLKKSCSCVHSITQHSPCFPP